MNRLFCKHQWKILCTTSYYARKSNMEYSWGITKTEVLMCCDKCGKNKVVKMTGEII